MVKWQLVEDPMVDAFQTLTVQEINRAAHVLDIVDSVVSIAIGTVSSQDFCSLYIFCHSQLRTAIISTAYFFW